MRFLRWLIDTESGKRIEHPALGEAVYFRAKLGSYWEVETEVNGWPFTLICDAENLEEPTDIQVEFFQRFASAPDLAFDRVSSHLIPAYTDWTKLPFPEVWRDEISFVGMTVPRSGDEQSNYELCFEGPRGKRAAHFACKLVDGRVAEVEVSS
jgi:hypothetical protein